MFILPGRHHIVYTSGVNERFRASWTRMSLWQCDTICTLPGWQSLNLIVPVALYQLHCYVSQHPFIRIKAVYAIRCVFFKFSFSSLFFQRITLKAIKPQWSCTFPSFQAKLRSGAAKKCAKYEDALQFRFRFFDIHWRENSDGGLVEAWGLSGAKQTAPAKSMNNVYLLGESVPGNATMCAL